MAYGRVQEWTGELTLHRGQALMPQPSGPPDPRSAD